MIATIILIYAYILNLLPFFVSMAAICSRASQVMQDPLLIGAPSAKFALKCSQSVCPEIDQGLAKSNGDIVGIVGKI